MRDPFGSMQGFMNQFQKFMQNPMSMLNNMKIAGDISNPNKMIQQLMNSGKMSQEQYNMLKNMADQIQNNPLFRNMAGIK